MSRDPGLIQAIECQERLLDWQQDAQNPHNFSTVKKMFVFLTTMTTVLNSSMGSSLTSNAVPFIAREFGITSHTEKVLPMSFFLIGYVFGPVLWAPLSEEIGRRYIITATFAVFTLFTMACAMAPNWASFLIFRLLTGIFGSAPVAIAPGILADVLQRPRARGYGIAVFMTVTGFGPVLGPIVSGFASPNIGWRWSFWIALAFAGLTMVLSIFLPETYAPVLQARHEVKLCSENPDAQTVSPVREGNLQSKKYFMTNVLVRPLRLLFTEPIVSCCSAFLAFAYAVFYMSFQAFPIIFENLYGLSPSQCGLTYLTVGVGCVMTLPLYWAYDTILLRAQRNQRPWSKNQEYYRLPLACVGGPMFVISLFWLGWSARKDIPFAVPIMAGVPFGMGFMCIFIALLNYLTDAYGVLAASAHAASSCSRSLLATVLPLAVTPMFSNLGIAGACSLLAGLSALMSVVPFIFIWKGEKIRANSKFCNSLKKNQMHLEGLGRGQPESAKV
ncbi:major facilitator superfamily domain-containing protein [Ilyonectria destructans]|nr:major facilitator superfamily domain-containing protein [Ilyonectria destructans]